MSIKPIDFQVIIPRATEVSKINSEEAHRNISLLQQQASSMQHKSDNALKQVYSRAKPQDARIMEKQKENRKDNRKEEKKKGKQGNTESTGLKNGIQTSIIDIKI